MCNFFKSQRSLYPFILISNQSVFGQEVKNIRLKKVKKIGHRVNFRDIFKKLTIEGHVIIRFW